MSNSSIDEVRLLADLVAVPSPSGSEDEVAGLAEKTARRAGLDVRNDELGVVVEVAGRSPGPTLALVSHLDTVPPGEGWSRDPFDPAIEDGRLFGRGSGDAKASVAAMLAAAADVAVGPGLPRGRLLVVLGRCEETRDTTMPALAATLGTIDAAVVGEPTNLDFAVAQRGLLRLDLVTRGSQVHAGRAGGDGFVNAIAALARDLVALEGMGEGRPHPVLGDVTVTPTMVEAGVSRNVTPPVARACLDVRTTPSWTHAELVRSIRDRVEAEVEVVSERLVPCETPAGSRLVAAAREARPAGRVFGSPTCSDWVWFRETDAMKCGPGTSTRSHTADECVDVVEVREGRAFFSALARKLAAG
jgi:acetylornithine deacetylase